MSENLEKYKNWFPKELEELLDISETEDYVIFTPRQYLGSDNFAKIATIVRDNQGEYISQGKESHFRYRKNTPPVANANVQKAYEHFEKGLILLKEEGYT